MFWGIDRDAWIQLWAGLLGAIPAAVLSAAVAAWVAVTVLNRSNGHQQVLAAEAAARQKALGEQQLMEQRAEAGRVRERAAIAEVVIATERFMHSPGDTPVEVKGRLALLQAAVARWRVELGSGPMEAELLEWTELLFVVALKQSKVADESGEHGLILARVIGGLSSLALDWASADESFRRVLLGESERRRLDIGASFAKIGES